MSKYTKQWLVLAAVITGLLCVIDASENRMLTVLADLMCLFSLVLLFLQRRFGFALMVIVAVATFVVNVLHSLFVGMNPVLAVALALLNAAFVPTITGTFLQYEWNELK